MKILYLVVLIFLSTAIQARPDADSIRISYDRGYGIIVPGYGDNKQQLEQLDSLMSSLQDSMLVDHLIIRPHSSPDGLLRANKRLMNKRTRLVQRYISKRSRRPVRFNIQPGRPNDYQTLYLLASTSRRLPYKEETLQKIQTIINSNPDEIEDEDDPLVQDLKQLRGGVPYQWICQHLYPLMRYTLVVPVASAGQQECPHPMTSPAVATLPQPDTTALHARTVPIQTAGMAHPSLPAPCAAPFAMAVKTNLIYDALLVPNIGVEFALPRHWSAALNWAYAWWNNDARHRFWRIYGGDVELRYWLGRKAAIKPLQGHHIGLYAQMLTYDIEWGGKGYLGDKWSYGAGFSYGYSLPLTPRLNMDFSLGVGYLGGKYEEYVPIDHCYVWQATKNRHFMGVTRAEVSLVWLIGKGNVNKRKGGGR